MAPAEDQHFGLVWERYFDGYAERFDSFLEIKGETHPQTKAITRHEQHGKSDFVLGFGKKSVSPAGDLAQRQSSLIAAMDGKTALYELDWHFATGLGVEHPTENGFTWHRTLGVPYLPGSSVKGLLRGYLEWLHGIKWKEDAPEDSAKLFTRWFGSPHKNPLRHENIDSRAGWFVFFDALPTGPVTLAADVMTPHMGGWYEEGGKIESVAGQPDPAIVPADWHSPNPVVFLVVKQASFQFGVAVRENLPTDERKQAQEALSEVLARLEEALQWTGAGAKTAAGYGRMTPIEEPLPAKLEQMVADLKQASHIPDDKINDIWRGQSLAKAWAALPEGAEKAAVKTAIVNAWKKHGWWDAPPPGAARKAKLIYEEAG